MKDVNDYKNPIKKSQNEMKGMKGILEKWNEWNLREIQEWSEGNPREIP